MDEFTKHKFENQQFKYTIYHYHQSSLYFKANFRILETNWTLLKVPPVTTFFHVMFKKKLPLSNSFLKFTTPHVISHILKYNLFLILMFSELNHGYKKIISERIL